MRLPATYKWIGLALLGLLIAVAVAIAATNLVSQQIGIASESVSAGDALAPAVSGVGNGGSGGARQDQPPADTSTGGEQTDTVPTEPPEPTTPAEPGDDHGSGSGEDGGEGSDD